MKHFLLIFLFFLIFVNPVLAAAPSIPGNFEVNISDTTVNISWDESIDAENDSIVYNWVLVDSSGYENITHTVRNESMVLYTCFNDGTSTDWSLYGNNGTDTNINYVSEDKYGYAAEFNGMDSYINCGNDFTLDITDAITIEAWVYGTTGNRTVSIVSRFDGNWVTGYGLTAHSTDTMCFWLGKNVEWTAASVSTGLSYVDGWHQYVGVWDGVTQSIYMDGEIKNSATPAADLSATGDLYIGLNYVDTNYFDGIIDLVRIYNCTLSPVEINANSNIIAESASYDNFTGVISNLSYGDYHIIVNARDNSTYSEWSAVYNFSITQPPSPFKASLKIIDQYRSDLVYNVYVNGTYVNDFNITDAYFVNSTNDTSITLTASQNYIDISNINNVRNFITGVLGFVLFVAFLFMAFKIGRGR